ncbi:MAG: hypothetical protein KDE22_15405 [Rhodobacterales bacterium]|nr:hypothetical protein [Rhodobacterales bacterium]
MTGSIWQVVLAAGLFVGLHILLSSAPVRRPLAGAVGETLFPALYSVAVGLPFAWMLYAYGAAPHVVLWAPPMAFLHLPLGLMPFAFILLVGSVTVPNPNLVQVAGPAGQAGPGAPRGVLKITRHPMMWAVGLYAVSHLLARGDAASAALFGGLALLALLGTLHQDHRRRAQGPEWAAFLAQTSHVPFVAVVQGRTTLRFADVGWGRILIGLALYGGMLYAHGWLFDANPMPLP